MLVVFRKEAESRKFGQISTPAITFYWNHGTYCIVLQFLIWNIEIWFGEDYSNVQK
jgi:hypothetical protein